jgi:hypothetical protein
MNSDPRPAPAEGSQFVTGAGSKKTFAVIHKPFYICQKSPTMNTYTFQFKSKSGTWADVHTMNFYAANLDDAVKQANLYKSQHDIVDMMFLSVSDVRRTISVGELIDRLMQVEDKSLPVFIYNDGERHELCESVPVDDTIEGQVDINVKIEN